MKNFEELDDLLADLDDQVTRSSASAASKDSKLVVYSGNTELVSVACDKALLILDNTSAVERFYAALGKPRKANLEVHGFVVDDDVLSALEECFSTVDEM